MKLNTAQWQRLAARVLAEEDTCHLCGHPLDFTAPPRSRYAPSVDHVIPRSRGGAVYARSNCRAAHYGCNAGKRDRVAKGFITSRVW